MPPKFGKLGPETAENGWQVFDHPVNFRTGRLSALTHGRYVTDSRQTLARYLVARAYTVQNNRMLTLGFACLPCI